jgi:hypothetical protein
VQSVPGALLAGDDVFVLLVPLPQDFVYFLKKKRKKRYDHVIVHVIVTDLENSDPYSSERNENKRLKMKMANYVLLCMFIG